MNCSNFAHCWPRTAFVQLLPSIVLLIATVGCAARTDPTAGPNVLQPAVTTPEARTATQPTAAAALRAGIAVYVGDELLSDYRPDAGLVTKTTRVDRPKFPVTDIHCHWTLKQDPARMLRAMDDLGLRRAVNLSGGWGDGLDQMLAKFHAVAPDRLLIFCNVDFDQIDDPRFSADTVRFLEDAHRKGVAGLKIFKGLGLTTKDNAGKTIPVDDPRLDPIWDTCGRLGMPVLIHSSDPAAFFRPVDRRNERWMQLRRHPGWSFDGPEFPSYEEVLAQHLRVIQRHPRTVFISAHLANSGEDLAKLSTWLRQCPNLYVDISGRVPELGRQPYAGRKFLIEFQDRVLFGTDRFPGRPDQPRERIYYRYLETDDEYFDYYDNPFPTEGEWRIYGAYLPDDVLRKVYDGNADRALRGLMPLAPNGGAAAPATTRATR
ncbi:MAG TPA: amidohydrolase family protein [Tepidisphaeraceae bacterium]|jgi:predicted TIM-barrel fold metal-dependent hydrolase|nr:amidohydrolase family protein [Tepidisphaeraceae bacterium]